jgi:hypothetical protein
MTWECLTSLPNHEISGRVFGQYNTLRGNRPTAMLQGGVGARPHPISDESEERDATEGACPMMDQVTLDQLRD